MIIKIKDKSFTLPISALIITTYIVFILWFFWEQIENMHLLPLDKVGTFFGGIFAPPAAIILIIQYLEQKNQNLRERNETKKKENERERLAQPLFDFENSVLYYFEAPEHNDAYYSLIFKIKNDLADATDVYIKASLKETNKKVFIEGVKTIFRGENKEIKIKLHASEFINFKDFKFFEDFEIELTFYDSLRLFRKKVYLCQIEHTYLSEDYTGGHIELERRLNVYESDNGY